MIIYILYYLVFKILSSFMWDLSYHDMYYKGCGLLCAHKSLLTQQFQSEAWDLIHVCTLYIIVLVHIDLSLSFDLIF